MKNLIILNLILGMCLSACEKSQFNIDATDIYVIDGDSVKIKGNNIRLVGFNTPETKHAQCDYERNLGKKAKIALARYILQANTISMRLKTKRNGELSSDKYGRRLGSLFVDEKNIANLMVNDGLAEIYTGRGKRKNWCH